MRMFEDSGRVQFVAGAWALLLLALALFFPWQGSWTIDDSVKRIAAETGEGLWAERLPDGSLRAALAEPAEHAPFEPPFAIRTEGGFAPGFSPWARALFKLLRTGGMWLWRLAPALAAVAMGLLLLRAGLGWAFLLLPLSFYGLVPWEHVFSWLLLWPAVLLALDAPEKATAPRMAAAGAALALAVLLRAETAILGVLLLAYLAFMKRHRAATALLAGAALGVAALALWQNLTAQQGALLQLRLNFAGTADADGTWLGSRALALYRLLLSMDLYTAPSLLLLALFAAGVALLYRAERTQQAPLWRGGLLLLGAWWLLYTYRLWTQPVPTLALIGMSSLAAALPWTALSVLPPYRHRPALWVGMLAVILVALTTPVWQGVHWGPRLLLFALPLFVLDLYRSGRARGKLFLVLLVLTALQTAQSVALVYARRVETAQRIERLEDKTGPVVVCRNQHQCADLAALWPGREFFTVENSRDLKQLLIEMRAARVDTVWLHLAATDSLYVQSFPEAKPVWPHRMTVIQAGTVYKTWWRLYELVMNRGDSLWAGVLETEAGQLALSGEVDAALRLQREAVQLTPHSDQVHHNLALILAGLGNVDEARREAEIALSLNPNRVESRRLLDLLPAPPGSAP